MSSLKALDHFISLINKRTELMISHGIKIHAIYVLPTDFYTLVINNSDYLTLELRERLENMNESFSTAIENITINECNWIHLLNPYNKNFLLPFFYHGHAKLLVSQFLDFFLVFCILLSL